MYRFVDLSSFMQVIMMTTLLAEIGHMFFVWMNITTVRRKFFVLHYSILSWVIGAVVFFIFEIERASGVPVIHSYPLWAHVLFLAYMMAMCIWAVIYERRVNAYNFTRGTIREAVDNLPAGLCFSNKEGRIVLANRSMYQFADMFFGQPLNNIVAFWDDLSGSDEFNGLVKVKEYCGRNMVTLAADGSFYQIMKKPVVIDSEAYTETTIYRVTRLHELRAQIANENERLKAQRVEIRNLATKMIKLNHEEELLNRKIQIHNEMGQYILQTRQLLQKGGSAKEYYEAALNWQQMTRESVSMEERYKKNYSELLDEIINIAKDIGCEVITSDLVPMELFENPLARQAVREAIINAVRHGQATKIFIDSEDGDKFTKLIISNDGKFAEGGASPKGGLKNLREGLKAIGGSLEIVADNRFTVVLKFPKE